MKNISSLFIFLAFVAAFVCCNKTEEQPTGSTGSVSFKYDSTKNFQSSYSGSVWEPNNGLLNITAKAGKSLLVINTLMPNGIKKGTYSFFASSPTGMAAFFREDSTQVSEAYFSNIDVGSFGILTITDVTTDSLITGTFAFFLKNPINDKLKVLLEGKITAVKVVNNKTIVTGGTNTFSAKIDGVLWSPKQLTAIKNFGNIQLTASDGTKSMGLSLVETIKTGTYQMDFGSDYHAQFSPTFSITNPQSYIAAPSTSKLTITEHNTATRQLKGTFSFKGDLFPSPSTKSYLITEGAFSMKY